MTLEMIRVLYEMLEVLKAVADEVESVEGIGVKGGPGSGNFGHTGRPGKRGGSSPSGPSFLNTVREHPVLTSSERQSLQEKGYYLHGTGADFDEFRKPQTGGGFLYFSEPVLRGDPSRKTQAEYIADHQGRLIVAKMDRSKLKRFDPMNDSKAREIYDRVLAENSSMSEHHARGMRVYPFTSRDDPTFDYLQYGDAHVWAQALEGTGYNAVRFQEPAVQGFSLAVLNPAIVEIVGDVRTTGRGLKSWDEQYGQKGGPGSGHHGHGGRPGQRGGSSPDTTSSGLQAALVAAEEQIVGQDFETAFAVDADGNEVMRKDGEKGSVTFSDEELGNMRGGVFTHNHPSGRSFSPDDIVVSIKQELAEMRAVGIDPVTKERVRYIWRPGDTFKKLSTPLAVVNQAYREAQKSVSQRFLDQLRTGTMTMAEANSNHHHAVWQTVSDSLRSKYGIDVGYEREVW